MNRFVIVDGLPFLYANGKTFAVRWDEAGFTVGAEAKLASVPAVLYTELSIKAKCAGHLDSIGKGTFEQEEPEQEATGFDILDGMTVAELKEFAESNEIDLGNAKKKAEILAAIKDAIRDGEAE